MSNNDNKTQERGFTPIATKVKDETMARFNALCKRIGKTPYTMLQLCVDTLVRYADAPGEMTADMEEMMHMFEDVAAQNPCFNLGDPDARRQITEATYYMTDASCKSRGVRGAMVRMPFFDKPDVSYNSVDILERCVSLLFPGSYRRLRAVAVEMDTSNVLETIDRLVSEFLAGADDRELAKIFCDNRRSDAGRTLADAPYRRHPRPRMESLFGNDDPAPDYSSCPENIPLPTQDEVDELRERIENGTL